MRNPWTMELQIVGAEGGELQEFRPPAFLFDQRVALDAGSLCSALSIQALRKIDTIFISHSHLDHVKDLGLLSDLMMGLRQTSVRIYGTKSVLDTLQKHYFNNAIWPDFTQIPTPIPILELCEITPLQPIVIPGEEEIRVMPIPVHHTVDTCGFLVSWKDGSFLYSADTGPTDLLWEVANRTADLRGVILDVAFPQRLSHVAKLSAHHTPASAAEELKKFKPTDIPVYFFHLKPACYAELIQELQPILEPRRREVLASGQRLLLG